MALPVAELRGTIQAVAAMLSIAQDAYDVTTLKTAKKAGTILKDTRNLLTSIGIGGNVELSDEYAVYAVVEKSPIYLLNTCPRRLTKDVSDLESSLTSFLTGEESGQHNIRRHRELLKSVVELRNRVTEYSVVSLFRNSAS